jgi:hypothetical protein
LIKHHYQPKETLKDESWEAEFGTFRTPNN